MLDSLFGIARDVAKIATAPVSIAAEVTRTVTKPLADVAQAAADEVSEVARELRDDHNQ